MSGIVDVLSRIQQIQARLAVTDPATGSDFAATLASATTTDASPVVTGAADGTPLQANAQPAVASGGSLATAATRYLGVPYVWGGTDPTSGLDCSGLVQRAAADVGIDVPRTSEEQARSGTAVASLAEAGPGDLVFFGGNGYDGTPSSPGHVGIYLGNGQMVDAPHAGTSVRVDPVGTPVAIRRISAEPAMDAAGGSGPPLAASAYRPADLAISAYTGDFASAAAASGVPAQLLAAVARTESGLDPRAKSPAGAEGLMQLMPTTAASLGVDPWVPSQAIQGAARLLAADHQRFGSWSLALAAYNAGAEAVAAHGGIPPYPETEQYVTKVLTTAGMA